MSRERLKGWECVSRQNERGDLLVFLSGLNEITALAEPMREYARETKKWIILMLHSTLPTEEQDKVPRLPALVAAGAAPHFL